MDSLKRGSRKRVNVKEGGVKELEFNAFNGKGFKRLKAKDIWKVFESGYFRGLKEMEGILSEEERCNRVLVFCYKRFQELDCFLREMILQCLDIGSKVYQPEEDVKLVILEPLGEKGLNKIREVIAKVLNEKSFKSLRFFILQGKHKNEVEIAKVLSLILTSKGFSLLPIRDRRVFLYHEIELLYHKYNELSNLIRSLNFSLNNLVFHLQPILNSSGNISGYEVLSRIKGNDGTLYYPGRFYWIFGVDNSLFHLFEEAVVEKFRYFLEEISKGSSNFSDKIVKKNFYMKNLEFHINFSPFFVIEHFSEVKDILFLAKQMKKKLCIELVETDLEIGKNMYYYESELNRVSREIKKNGGLFILDDFGTGHNNFDLLQKVRFDGIKIPVDFVINTTRNGSKANSRTNNFVSKISNSIQEAMGYLCKSVVDYNRIYFEKIEDYVQYKKLKENVCSSKRCFFQGFALGEMLIIDGHVK